MTKAILLSIPMMLAILAGGHALSGSGTTGDAQAIRDVLKTHYVEGLYVKRDRELLGAGLASNFVMQVYWNGALSTRTREAWLAKIKPDSEPSSRRVESEIRVLDITGAAAVARVDLHVDGVHKYTDFFGLYKAEAGWKMTVKFFHAHSQGG